MKCEKCGAEIEEGVMFCRECGEKVQTNTQGKKFCRECGCEIVAGSKFCPNCGANVTVEIAEEASQKKTDPEEKHNNISSIESNGTFGEKLKTKAKNVWNGMDLFYKSVTILSGITLLMFLLALCVHKVFPILFSVIQIIGLVSAVLIHRDIIKLPQKWIKYLVMVGVGVFALLNVFSYSWKNTPKAPANEVVSNVPKQNDNNASESATAKIPVSVTECAGMNYSELQDKLYAEGFTNVTIEAIEDLGAKESETLGSVESITVGGSSDYSTNDAIDRSTPIVIMYHEFADCMITMHVDFVPNLIFSKYNVKVKLNGIEKEVLEHGEDRDFSFKVKPGQCTVSFENAESSSVTGEIAFNVKGTINTSVKISCHSDKIDVKTEFIEDMGALEEGQLMIGASNADYKGTKFADTQRALEDLGFKNIQTEPVYDTADGSDDLEKVIEVSINGGKDYKRGDVFDSDTAVVISYHANENDDPVKIAEAEKLEALEGNVPKEMASRAIIVAMTNCESTDVFESDGNTYDTAKFHSYDNIDDFFMVIYEDGEWSVVDETKWHVSGMVLRMYDRDMYLKVDCDVSKNEDNYIVENVDRAMAAKEDLEDEDLSKVHMEPSESNSFLTVQGTLIESDRDETMAWEKMTAKEERQKWIEDQFALWDGRHKELSELIKHNLNDEKSFKHVEVKYVDVYDEERKKIVNGVLADVGVSQRVEIGDLFVMETFTAKNAFNATIKSTGYGIVTSDGVVTLLAIE